MKIYNIYKIYENMFTRHFTSTSLIYIYICVLYLLFFILPVSPSFRNQIKAAQSTKAIPKKFTGF